MVLIVLKFFYDLKLGYTYLKRDPREGGNPSTTNWNSR